MDLQLPVFHGPRILATTAAPTDEYIPISAATLTPATSVGVNVYLRSAANDSITLYCAATEQLDVSKIDRLIDGSAHKLFIHRDDCTMYQKYLREQSCHVLHDEEVPVEKRIELMCEVMRDVLNEQFSMGTTESIVEACQSYSKTAVALLDRNEIFLAELYKVLHHDYGTFTHSANVSAYAILLARALGFNRDDLEQIGVGALLHDLGKLEVDDRILNKPGRLDEDEWKEIKKHPAVGLQRIVHREDLSFGQLMMVYQHHERFNGTGYPVGCAADEIHPWARICAVVDVFEALTSLRPYRHAMKVETALAVLEKGLHTEFDAEMVRCWRSLVIA